ncbi:unnamed protein product [Symbiodinium necroappetens]|uniref:Uncharacterized protein n=1 Tax=Symbiodinium necroappetens TaxID=1628268 RepID=A0A812P3Z3_9DINO|nr:unnamed protein product [Symbiodinium necroappetens]
MQRSPGPELQRLEAALPDLGVPPERGLPSWQVRANYHETVGKLEDKLANMRYGGPTCELAELAVQGRKAARVRARLQGSSAMHFFLQLRDLMTYGSWSPFTLEKLMAQKRAKLQKAESVTDEALCSSIVGSATRTSEAWNTRAEVLEHQGSSYVQETFMCPGRDLGGLTWRVGMSGFRAFRAVESLKFTCWF